MDASTIINSDRVELLWPGKHDAVRVFQDKDGKWDREAVKEKAVLRGLTNLRFVTDSRDKSSFILSGQRHDALRMLARSVGPVFRLIYIDLPRLEVDDVATAFQSVSPLRLTTWLSVVRALILEARDLLSRRGVLAVHCGEDESQYARIILDELFRDKRVGTIVWQKAYSAQNMPGMKSFTDTHDLMYVYARDLDALPAVGLRRPPKGYSNEDEDPRGPWKAEHKGAKTRRDNSDFDTYQPPYRWKIIKGDLPPGIWRLSPATGVIWGEATKTGTYEFTAEVTDSVGASANAHFKLTVKDAGEPAPATEIPWIFEEVETEGVIRVIPTMLPEAIIGKSYSAVIFAEGGSPFKGEPIRPGSGRYWDFAKATLVEAYQKDAVYLGSKQPTSIPTPKKYKPPEGIMEIENQQSIWLGRSKEGGAASAEVFAGFTEDATKHLKTLKALGIIKSEISTAKPEKLMARLLNIFTDKDDLVLEVMSSTADLTAVAIKSGRRAIALQGSSIRDTAITDDCAIPRLRAVVEGEDQNLEERAPKSRLSSGAYIPYEGGGSIIMADVGPTIAELLADEDYASLTNALESMSHGELVSSILTAEGYIPSADVDGIATAISGKEKALVITPAKYLTPELVSKIASDVEHQETGCPVNIYYFRATEDIDEKLFGGRVSLRRVPFDLLRMDVA